MIILSLPQRDSAPAKSQPSIWTHLEHRVDYHPDPFQIDFSLYTPIDIVCWRNAADPVSYLNFVQSATNNSIAIIDVDVQLLTAELQTFICERHILSLHLQEYNAGIIVSFLEYASAARYKKIAFHASTWSQIENTVEAIRISEAKNVIFSVTGPWGKLQRLMYKHTESCAVYIHGGEATAEGQLSIDEAIACRLNNDVSEYYAIVGHNRVDETLSFHRYNQMFTQTQVNAQMLPVPAQNTDEAFRALSWINRIHPVLGIAITNPLKQVLSSMLSWKSSSANTVLFSDQPLDHNGLPPVKLVIDTDILALRDSLHRLSVKKTDSILIFGSGSTAQSFAVWMVNQGYRNVMLGARNPYREKQVRYNAKVQAWDNTKPCVDVLINCTPFGSCTSDNPYNMPCFLKLIDLPYQGGETTLVHKAILEGIPYIDGVHFWEIQNRYQCVAFELPLL